MNKVNDCIAYIESCGFVLERRGKIWGHGRPYYVFRGRGREITFTLSELRDAKKNGW